MKQISSYLKNHRSYIAVATGLLIAIGGLLWFRLSALTYGFAAPEEVSMLDKAFSWHAIVQNPLNAPYLVPVRLLSLAGRDSLSALRFVSTVYGLIVAVLFYIVARTWHSQRIALLASGLFITSAWFLHVSRLATPDILLLVSMLAIIVLLSPNKNGRQTWLALPSTLYILAVVAYVPGMIWLITSAVLMQRKNIREAWQATTSPILRIVSIGVSLLILTPLIYRFVQQPSLVRSWLGIPADLQANMSGLVQVAHNIANVPQSLLIRSDFSPVYWLGNLPLLSSFEILMLLLGAYFYASHLRAARTRLILLVSIVSLGVVGLQGLQSISLIIPLVYLLVAAGVAYLLHQWLKVFPANPLARSVGIGLMLLAVVLTSLYQTRSYFVAWHYSQQTQAAFTERIVR